MSNDQMTKKMVSWVQLQDIAEVVMGQSPPSSAYNDDGTGLPFFQGKTEFGPLYPTARKWCSAPTKIAELGDVLMSIRAPVGPTNIAAEKCCIGRGLAAIRPGADVRLKWLLYAFRSMEAQIDALGTGTTFKAISGGTLRTLRVPYAAIETQDIVVAEIEKQFSRLDEAVANLHRVKANLKRYKASVLKDAVEGRLVPTEAELARRDGRSFETGEQLLQRILETRRSNWSGKGRQDDPVEAAESSGNKLPEGWCWATIDQLTVVVRGGSPRPAGDPRFFGGTVPWITVGSLTADGSEYLQQVRDTLTDEGKERSRFIDPHTLLLTNSGATLGVPKISLIGGCINDGVAALLNVEYPLKLYLLHFLRTLTDSMRRINQGAAQPNLNTTIIKATRVPLPPVTEQQRIVTEIDRRMSLLSSVEMEVDANLKRAQALRQSMLAKAFSEGQA